MKNPKYIRGARNMNTTENTIVNTNILLPILRVSGDLTTLILDMRRYNFTPLKMNITAIIVVTLIVNHASKECANCLCSGEAHTIVKNVTQKEYKIAFL